jgi:16S rRNA (guanine1207-N2)-methyltransferase
VNVASELLIDEVLAQPIAGHACVFGGDAALLLALDGHSGTLAWLPTDIREVANLALHDYNGVVVHNNVLEPDVEPASVDLAILPAAPDRDLNRRWLALADRLLGPVGRLIVAGANREGIRSVIADAAAVFGPVTEDFRRKHRIGVLQRRDAPATSGTPAWLTAPGIAPGTWREFVVTPGEGDLRLVTLPGVFAGDRLDAGTALLLAHLDVRPGTSVLDVGCGAGTIGIAAARAAARAAASRVDLVDANLLAVAAARENLRRLRILHARALASDVYEAVKDVRYDLVVSNPPFHRGKEIDVSVADRIIREAPRHLAPGGDVRIVANAFLAYGRRMSEVFRHVETVAATRQYHVIAASDPR